jgi:hypothetical protein
MGLIDSFQNWLNGLATKDPQLLQILIMGLVVFVLLKPVGVRLVQGFMFRRSLRRRAKAEAAASAADDTAQRSDPGTRLEFVEANSASSISTGGTVVPTVMSWARRLYRVDITAAASYAVTAILFTLTAGVEDDALVFGVPLAMFSMLGIAFFSYTYFVAGHTSEKLRLLVIGLAALTALVSLFTQHFVFGLTVAFLVAAHWFVSRKVRREMEDLDVPNLKLLVLRVFGLDKNTRFTFGQLEAFWQYLGPYFTVVDPTYIRYRFRWSSPTTLRFLIVGSALFGGFIIGMISGDNEATGLSGWVMANPILGTVTLAAIGLPLAVGGIFIALFATFAGNREAIKKKISATLEKKRTKDFTTPDLAMFCYDDTWKVAVDEFSSAADAVLMDLRGYSAARKGCEYEVSFLVDKLPLDRVVFLADTDTDREAIRDLLRREWSSMLPDSPNRELADGKATIYTASKHDARDIQSIVTLLLGAGLRTPVEVTLPQ